MRSKVCIADWNGDGRPDLLVGDFASQKPDLPEPTPQQKAEYDKLRAQMKQLEPRYSEAMDKYFRNRSKLSAEEREKVGKEFNELSQEMQKIREKLPPESEEHGWVWLYLRK